MLLKFLDTFVLGHVWSVAAVTRHKAVTTIAYTNMQRSHERALYGFVQILFACQRCGVTVNEELLGEKLDLAAYLAERMKSQ